jgi:hypothetical protein
MFTSVTVSSSLTAQANCLGKETHFLAVISMTSKEPELICFPSSRYFHHNITSFKYMTSNYCKKYFGMQHQIDCISHSVVQPVSSTYPQDMKLLSIVNVVNWQTVTLIQIVILLSRPQFHTLWSIKNKESNSFFFSL